MADRFFTPDPLAPGEYLLAGAEAHHLATVRRLAPGDRLTLFNGDGHEYLAELVFADRKKALLNILSAEPIHREIPFPVEIAAAMPKGDRGDFLVEKLVELGVARFTPLLTRRTVVSPKESRLANLRQGVIEASKQCGRNVLMEIGPLTAWEAFLARSQASRRIILHPDGLPLGGARESVSKGITLAIGPEGGFAPEEVGDAMAAGWEKQTLGPRILRVETAGIAAAAWAALQ